MLTSNQIATAIASISLSRELVFDAETGNLFPAQFGRYLAHRTERGRLGQALVFLWFLFFSSDFYWFFLLSVFFRFSGFLVSFIGS
jgi:hypothetical protein